VQESRRIIVVKHLVFAKLRNGYETHGIAYEETDVDATNVIAFDEIRRVHHAWIGDSDVICQHFQNTESSNFLYTQNIGCIQDVQNVIH